MCIRDSIDSTNYVEVSLENGKTIKIDVDSKLLVKPEGKDEAEVIYADQLQEGDDILFDNKDVLFTINEL